MQIHRTKTQCYRLVYVCQGITLYDYFSHASLVLQDNILSQTLHISWQIGSCTNTPTLPKGGQLKHDEGNKAYTQP